MEVTWIAHNNKKVLLIDFTGIVLEQDMISLLNTVPSFFPKVSDGTILTLSDITGCFATPGFTAATKKLHKEVFNKYKIKQAVVGVVGAKVILLKTINLVIKNKLVPFKNRSDALDYLTSN